VAVNRSMYGATGSEAEAFLPAQSLDPASAFAAYTIGSAFVNHLDETGSVEEGRLADLVVLDRDPIAGDRREIGATSVLATFVEGEAVYRSPGLS
jgi:predicted amidohydrolase YtcJ